MARHGGTAEPAEALGAVTQELLVRYLDAWTPAALHSAKRITYGATGANGSSVAALRVFTEFADRLAGHRLAMVLAAPTPEVARVLGERLEGIRAEIGAPPEVTVHVAAAELIPALTEQGAFGSPLFAYVDCTAALPQDGDLSQLAGNRGTEVLLAIEPATAGRPASTLVTQYRDLLAGNGLPETVHVELVAGDCERLLIFATAAPKHVEKFKDELWAVDEFAGVRYRDPNDDTGTLLDISLTPDVGPLRRTVLRWLSHAGPQTVADLRQFALSQTLYRSADLSRLLPPMLSTGAVRREPERGRLTATTVISPR